MLSWLKTKLLKSPVGALAALGIAWIYFLTELAKLCANVDSLILPFVLVSFPMIGLAGLMFIVNAIITVMRIRET